MQRPKSSRTMRSPNASATLMKTLASADSKHHLQRSRAVASGCEHASLRARTRSKTASAKAGFQHRRQRTAENNGNKKLWFHASALQETRSHDTGESI
mmetsp:Transcript_74877/g.188506  ORF Transcript_74877/g.188506 Transcript_74877/m.188506 type:complete len:98 (+) Transcript_74877:417-710(+)